MNKSWLRDSCAGSGDWITCGSDWLRDSELAVGGG